MVENDSLFHTLCYHSLMDNVCAGKLNFLICEH